MEETILKEIIDDLSDNYQKEDENVINNILKDVINDALYISNRRYKTDDNLTILKINIKKAVKTIYLQRGVEDVKSNSISGRSNTYDNAIETMRNDIIKSGKRIVI